MEGKKTWYVYEVPPIDFNWEMLRTVRETIRQLVDPKLVGQEYYSKDENNYIDTGRVQKFLNDWEYAQDMALKTGWEGDFRHEPVVFWVPIEGEFAYGFAWKQENNGTTYVVSPIPMNNMHETHFRKF